MNGGRDTPKGRSRRTMLASVAVTAVVLLLLPGLAPAVQASGSSLPNEQGLANNGRSHASSGSGGADASSSGPSARTTTSDGCTYPTGWLPACVGTQGVGMPLISSSSPWQPVSPLHAPPDSASGLGTMAYDRADGYLVLVTWNWTTGADETWTFSAGQWTKLAIASPPLTPFNAPSPTMVFDPETPGTSCFVGTSGCLVLMMGRANASEYEWQYAAGAWTNESASVTMMHGPWTALGLIYDPNGSDCLTLSPCLLAVSGIPANQSWQCGIPCVEVESLQTTWEYMPSFHGWEDISVAAGPIAGRMNVVGTQDIFYDPVLGHAVLVTPQICFAPPNVPWSGPAPCGGYGFATYEMTPSGWATLGPGCPPSAGFCSNQLLDLQDAGYAFDEANRFLLLFGGAYSNASAENTTWSYYGDQVQPISSAWIDVTSFAGLGTGPKPQPDQRVEPLMSYDPNPSDCGAPTPPHGCVILFGGADCPVVGYCFVDELQDTWRFWLPVTPEIYANPDPVAQGHTLSLNVTVIGGTGRFVWYNRTWQGGFYPVGCSVNTIFDNLHSRVICVPTFSTSCPGPHGNFFNVSVAVTDSAGEQGISGWDPLIVNPSPLITHYYDRYPVWWKGVDLGLLDPVGINDLTDNFGVATWAEAYSPSSPSAWVAIDAEAVLVQEHANLPIAAVYWDGVWVDYATFTPSELSALPLDDSIEFSVQLGPAGSSSACATVYETLDLNATYGKHHLANFPVGLSGQYGAVDPGSMLQPLLEGIPALMAATTATITTLSWGQQGGHGQILAFNATYFINATLSMNIAALTGATLPDPVAGTASIIPRANVALSISSFGKVTLTAGASIQFPLGKVAGISFTITESFTAQAKFQFEQYYNGLTQVGSLVLTNFSISMGVVIKASVTFPIYGISLGPLGTVGFTMTIAVSLGATIGLFFNQTNPSPVCPTGCFLGWLPVVLQKVQALISLAISIALGFSLLVASISMGGTLEFDIYLQNVQPNLRGMQLIGTIFVTVSVLFWSWTDNLWSGVIWSEGNPTPGIATGPAAGASSNSFVVGPRYYNISGYQSLRWVPGSTEGPLMNDIYPGGTFDMAGGSATDALLYGTDNVSKPRNLGLTLGLLQIDPANRTVSPENLPLPPGEVAFNPRVVNLGGGALLALWDALPDAGTTVAGPAQVASLELQAARFDPTSRTWGPATTLSTGAFPLSYTAGACGTDTRVVHLDAPSLLGHGGTLVEQDLSSGSVLAQVSAPLGGNIVSFDCPSGLVAMRGVDGNYSVINMTSGSPWTVPTVRGFNLSYVTHVAGSPGDLAFLYRNNSTTLLQVDDPAGQVLSNVSLPENLSTLQVALSGGTWVVAGQAPDGVLVYLVDGSSAALVRDLAWGNLTQVRLAVSSSGVATLVGETKNGDPGLPWQNLSTAFLTLTAVGPISASPPSVDSGAPVTFRATAESVNGPLQYFWSGLPPGCVSLNAPSVNCTPAAAGSYGISLRVTDSRGSTATSPTLEFQVVAPPAAGAVNASRTPIEVGMSESFAAPGGGAVGNSSFSYFWSGVPPGCTSVSTPLLVCTPSAPGNYSVGVTVEDARGGSVSERPVAIEVLPRLALSTLSASASPVVAGSSVRLSASGQAGVSPYTFAWGGLPSGCASSAVSSLSCTFPSAGTYWVTVVITDAQGISAAGSIKITVVSSPGLGLSAFLLELLLLVGLAAVAAANVAVWWWRPRRGRSGGSSSKPEAAPAESGERSAEGPAATPPSPPASPSAGAARGEAAGEAAPSSPPSPGPASAPATVPSPQGGSAQGGSGA
ncbi:MAG: hypothetical protein KGJ23_12000 [Euryarchaeota archaeon]|nr:hypothetical protein [Euryarchaeota archaeon]MDE2045250.1 hypothetical protein [Thermoplasmata archaeon]